MVTAEDFGRSLRGAADMVGRRAEGAAAFDTSVEGFRRSFEAIALTIPAFAVSLAMQRRAMGLDVAGGALLDDLGLAAILGAAHVGGFLLMPVAMVAVARELSLGSRYVPFVVALNWLSVFGSLGLALPGALYLMNLETGALTTLFTLAFSAILIHAQWFATRVTLGIGGGLAAGLTTLGAGLSLGLHLFVRAVIC